jgi:hypothetical protein
MNATKDSWLFTTPDKKFSWELPSYWEEYDDGEEDTYAFYYMASSSIGNLRITPLIMQGNPGSYKDKSTQFIEEEIEQNKDAVKVKLGDLEGAFYKSETVQNDIECPIYYWTTGAGNTVFICSFIIEDEQGDPDQEEEELERVRQIISSIRIIE